MPVSRFFFSEAASLQTRLRSVCTPKAFLVHPSRGFLALLLFLSPFIASPSEAEGEIEMLGPSPAGIYEATLENGLKVLMKEVQTAPLMCVSVWYRAGTKHESSGTTGLAHLLEHMSFKGTERIPKGVFDRTLEANGATNNATTWLDRTNYYILVAAEKTDLAMELQSDLMRNALFTDEDLQDEMPVVRNELEWGQDDPWNELDERLGSTAILEHPYHWPTIGWESDVEAITAEQIHDYYDRFYHPNNAYLVLVGDLPVEEMLKKANHHYGGIPAGGEPQNPVTIEPPQKGERRFLLREAGSTRLLGIAYRTPEAVHPDVPDLDMTYRILGSGKSSRLYKALVDTGLAVSVSAYAQVFEDPYVSTFFVTLADGADPDEVEARFDAEIARLQIDPPTDVELQRALKKARVDHYFSLDQLTPLMFAIGESEAVGGYDLYERYLPNLEAVTSDDVRRVAAEYLIPDSRTVGFYLPRGAQGGGWVSDEDKGQVGENKSGFRSAGAGEVNRPRRRMDQADGRHERGGSGRAGAVSPTRYVLRNGAVVLVQESRENPTVAIRARFAGGLLAEPEGQEGVAGLLAGCLARGTASLSAAELTSLMEENGIQIEFEVERDALWMSGHSLSEDWPLLVELLGEILRDPSLEAGQIELARTLQQNRIQTRSEDTFLRAYQRGLDELFGTGSAYSRPFYGTLSSLDRLTRDHLVAFHEQWTAPANWSFAVVGDVETEDVHKQLESAVGSIRPREVTPLLPPPLSMFSSSNEPPIKVPLADKSQIDLVFLAEGVSASSPDYPAAYLANVILGGSFTSRLNGHLRDDEGLTYGAWSDFVERDGAHYWMANLGVHPDNVPAALSGVRNVLTDLRENGVTDEEIEKAREYAAGSFPIQLQSKSQVAGTLLAAEALGHGMDYISGYGARLRAVSNEAVRSAIATFADPDQWVVAVSGTFAE